MARKEQEPQKMRELRAPFQKGALALSAFLFLAASSGYGKPPDGRENPIIPTPTPSLLPIFLTSPTSTPIPEAFPTAIKEPTELFIIPFNFESKIIDSMETFGDDKPLSQTDLLKLYKQLNSKEQEMRNDTYYGTIFIAKKIIDEFQITNGGETFQEFLKRHEKAFNQMVQEQPYPDTNKLQLRRLIVVEDAVEPPYCYTLNNEIKDSDGGWSFVENLYFPKKAPYYDKNVGIDYGLEHEFAHAFLHLPDQYSLDFGSSDWLPESITENVPAQWKKYSASSRNDIGQDLMNNANQRIGIYTNLQILRRVLQEEVHNNKKTVPEVWWNFPYEIPEKTTFAFGKDYSRAAVDIFQSVEVDEDKRPSEYNRKKKLELIGNYTNSEDGNLTLTKDKLFLTPNNPDNLIKAENSTLFLLVTTTDGKQYFRWMDIRDFNIPFWLGYQEQINMNFKLASGKDDPKTFDWRIKYSNEENR